MSWSADNRLTLIRIKIERAEKHLAELESAIGKMGNAIIQSVITNFDSETGKPSFRFSQYNIYNAEIPAIAGDIVHNLRSALDHLAFHLVQVGVETGEERTFKWEDIQFPIFHSLNSYELGKGRRIQGARREAKEAIDRVKPYKGGCEDIWLLRRLDNADKHSFIIGIGGEGMVSGVPLNTGEPFFTSFVDSKDNKNVELSLEKTGIQLPIVTGKALLPTLHQLADLVSNIVESFRPLLGSDRAG